MVRVKLDPDLSFLGELAASLRHAGRQKDLLPLDWGMPETGERR